MVRSTGAGLLCRFSLGFQWYAVTGPVCTAGFIRDSSCTQYRGRSVVWVFFRISVVRSNGAGLLCGFSLGFQWYAVTGPVCCVGFL